MLREYELERIKDQRFFSEKHQCFVEIKGTEVILKDQTIDIKTVSVLDKETQEIISDLLYETKTKYRVEKQRNSKGSVLLGINTEGVREWLQPPSWDCSWYWGFGYIQTPHSHSHFSGLVGEQEYYDHEKGCFRKGEYIHNVYDSPELIETTFTSNEGWKLSELFKQFYLLQDMAEYTYRTPAGCHITTSPVEQDVEKMKEWHKEINEVMIPKITAEIMRMLTPVSEVRDEI